MTRTFRSARIAWLLAATAPFAALAACSEDSTTGDATAGKAGGSKGGTTGGTAGAPSGGRSAGGTSSAGRGAGASGSAGTAVTAGAGGGAGLSTGGSAGNGTSGSGAGSAGASGGRAGASGSGGGGRDGGTAGTPAGAAGEGGATGTPSGCAGRGLLLCEDFESTAVGSVPSGWTRHGDLAAVSGDDAHGGSRALRLGAASNSERRIYHDASILGSAHWGRIYYKVETPVPDAFVHSTMVSLIGDGPQNGRSDYRPIDTIKQAKDTPDVGGRHNFIFNVQIIGDSEFGTETNYDYTFDAEWHCAEYHIQASNQSYVLYLDGDKILEFEHGAGNYDDSDIPNSFDELRVGWINYQNAPPGFTAWIDDLAFDDARIGCD